MIYIHIPFCKSFCTYCDFYSEVVPSGAYSGCGDELFRFFNAKLSEEILSRKTEFSKDVNTLYIGGGTPSVLPPAFFASLADTLSKAGYAGPYDEFTVEVNPEDIVEKGVGYVRALKSCGVNRISMGVQSFDDGLLKWMNRRHNAMTAKKAYGIIEEAGIENVSIDLIFGLPQLSDMMWEDTLNQALSISGRGKKPSHISAYQLSVESGSALGEYVRCGKFKEAGQEQCRRQYDILCVKLASEGYRHYEISNFALPGREARHNSAYWSHVPYSGFGPGAHSFIAEPSGMYIRKWNSQNLKAYLACGDGDFSGVSEGETLSMEQYALEKIMLSLRTDEGLELDWLMAHGNRRNVKKMLSYGALTALPNGRVRIPENQFFVSDGIVAEIA